MDKLNIAENRNHLNYSKWIYIKRILWTFGKFFFPQFSPYSFRLQEYDITPIWSQNRKTRPYLFLHRYLVSMEFGNWKLECHWGRNPNL